MRFKVGDKVRVRENLVGLWDWQKEGRENYVGKTVTIAEPEVGVVESTVYRILEDDGYFWWTDVMLEPIADPLMAKVMERNNKPAKTYSEQLKELTEPLDLIEKHKRVCERLNKVYADKNHDYGNSFGETYEKLGAVSAVTRISDKTSRLQSLVTKDEQRVDDESLLDTALDLANYAIMLAMELEGEV